MDALVVGAGPAGSLAAFHLARGGARVLLTDKARFPRDKPCGGGITVRAERQLPFSIDPVVEDAVDVFELRLGYGRHFRRRTHEPLIRMTQRRRLDAFLVEQAREAGAEFRDGFRPDDTIEAEVVIGADGANGTTGRKAGLDDHLRTVALEGNAAVDLERFAGRAWIEFGVVPGGYGWVFPKADHVNVGVGGWHSQGPQLRAHLARLCREHGIPERELTDVRGHRLPLRRPGSTAARGRLALVGDAAGLVDPVSGDGIYEAVLSARLAAANALDILAGRKADFTPVCSGIAPPTRGAVRCLVAGEDGTRPLPENHLRALAGPAGLARDRVTAPRRRRGACGRRRAGRRGAPRRRAPRPSHGRSRQGVRGVTPRLGVARGLIAADGWSRCPFGPDLAERRASSRACKTSAESRSSWRSGSCSC